MIVERVPKLEAPRGSLDRSWQIAIGESHKSRIIKLWRVAIDIDSGMLSFCRSDKEEWLSHKEWRDTSSLSGLMLNRPTFPAIRENLISIA